MTLSERADEILNSTMYSIYCPVCGARESIMFDSSMFESHQVTAYCRSCGMQNPMSKQEDLWS